MLISLKTEKKSRFLKILGYVWTGPYKMYLHVINSYVGIPGLTTFFIPGADYFGSCLFLFSTDMTRVYTTKNVCGNTTTNHYGLLPVYCHPPLSIALGGGGGSVWSKNKGEGALRRITKKTNKWAPCMKIFVTIIITLCRHTMLVQDELNFILQNR